jgi:hypothetical protein
MDESKNNGPGSRLDREQKTTRARNTAKRSGMVGLATSEFFALGLCDPDALVPFAQSIQG